jgi:hypothetical protein
MSDGPRVRDEWQVPTQIDVRRLRLGVMEQSLQGPVQ